MRTKNALKFACSECDPEDTLIMITDGELSDGAADETVDETVDETANDADDEGHQPNEVQTDEVQTDEVQPEEVQPDEGHQPDEVKHECDGSLTTHIGDDNALSDEDLMNVVMETEKPL